MFCFSHSQIILHFSCRGFADTDGDVVNCKIMTKTVVYFKVVFKTARKITTYLLIRNLSLTAKIFIHNFCIISDCTRYEIPYTSLAISPNVIR
jgi:hypothetical protein